MAQQTADLPPFEQWDPIVLRWAENDAILDMEYYSSMMAAVLVDDTPWAKAVATALPEETLATIVDEVSGLIGFRSGSKLKGSVASPEAESSVFPQGFQDAFEKWRNERGLNTAELQQHVQRHEIANLFLKSSQMSGGRVTPWPLLCLVATRYMGDRDLQEYWSVPVIVRTRHAIRLQRSVEVEQARAIADGRWLVVLEANNVNLELLRLTINQDLAAISVRGGEFRKDEVAGITLAEYTANNRADFPNFLRDVVEAHPEGTLVWFLMPHDKTSSKDYLDDVDHFLRIVVSLKNDVLISTPPAKIQPVPEDALSMLFDRLTRIVRDIPVARPAISDRAEGEDLLNQERVARAMALVASLKESTLPLCFGLFGEWGSGKSFLMELIAKEINGGLKSAPAAMSDKVHNKIAVIRFNAWTFAKSELWSALLYQILRTLQTWRYQDPDVLTEDLAEKAATVEEHKAALAKTEHKIDLVKRQIAIRTEASPGVLIRAAGKNRLAELEATVRARGEEWKNWPHDLAVWLGQSLTGKNKWYRAGALWVMVLTVIALLVKQYAPGLLDWLPPDFSVNGWLIALAGLIPGGTATLEAVKKTAGKLRKNFNAARDVYQETQKQVEDAVAKLGDVANANLLQEATKLETVRAAEAKRLEQSIKVLAKVQNVAAQELPVETLDKFLAQRLTEGDYASRLGPMQQVERDLSDLSLYFTQSDMSNGAPERVVLCIDDLDRCPPDKVVEILEAIQLLLADNSDLQRGKSGHPFVIILSADTRILTRALEKEYSEVLTRSRRPSGLDYIEKIIQIPYWIPPIDQPGFERYVVELTGVGFPTEQPETQDKPIAPEPPTAAAADTSRFEPVEFPIEPGELVTGEDMRWFRTFQVVAPTSPRAVKRLVNQFRLCKAIAMQSGASFSTLETIFLLFIADGFRASARIIARRLELKVEADSTLIEFFNGLLKGPQDLGTLKNEISLLLERLDGIKDDLPTLDALRRISRDVLPYCFIGDVSQRAGQDVSQVQLDSAVAMWSDVDIASQPGGEADDER